MMLLLSFCTYNGVPFVGIYNKTNQTLRLYALSPDFVLVIVVHHGRLTELRSGRRTTTHVSPFHRVVLQQLLDQVDMRKEHSAAAIPTQSHVVQNILFVIPLFHKLDVLLPLIAHESQRYSEHDVQCSQKWSPSLLD